MKSTLSPMFIVNDQYTDRLINKRVVKKHKMMSNAACLARWRNTCRFYFYPRSLSVIYLAG